MGLTIFPAELYPQYRFHHCPRPAIHPGFGAVWVCEGTYCCACIYHHQHVTDKIISPRVMGRGLDLSPLAVFILLIFWAWVLGLVGAIMAVPLLVIMKMFLGRFDDTRRLAVAISGDS